MAVAGATSSGQTVSRRLLMACSAPGAHGSGGCAWLASAPEPLRTLRHHDHVACEKQRNIRNDHKPNKMQVSFIMAAMALRKDLICHEIPISLSTTSAIINMSNEIKIMESTDSLGTLPNSTFEVEGLSKIACAAHVRVHMRQQAHVVQFHQGEFLSQASFL